METIRTILWMKTILIGLLFFVHLSKQIDNQVKHHVKVYGPGLQPHKIVTPARYFIINVTYINEQTYYKELRKDLFVEISGTGPTNRKCRLWTDRQDRKDGTYIQRFKIYETCYTLKIEVVFKNEYVDGFPLLINEPVQPALCDCPEPDYETWRNRFGCQKSYKQFGLLLKPFEKVDMKTAVKKIVQRFNNPASTSFCHYVIKRNKLFRQCYGQHVGFHTFSDDILQQLSRLTVLPDMELVINLGDYPLVKKGTEPLPIFSWCGSNDTIDIVLPTYDLTESTLESMGRVSLDVMTVQGNAAAWRDREPRAFWRGRDSRPERLRLIDIARTDPELFNVSLTNFFFYKDKEAEYGPKQNHISFYSFFDYKYQINIDGTVAAYRLPYLMGGAGFILKQESPFFEHFYKQIKPWVHYVPVARDLSDLKEKILWARDHDDEAHEIGNNARKFVNDNLMPHHIICYYASLLTEWSKRITSPISSTKNMVYAAQTVYPCECHRDYKGDIRRDEL